MDKLSGFLKRNTYTLIMVCVVFAIVAALAYFLVSKNIDQLRATAEDRFQLEVDSIIAHTKEKYSGGATTLRSLQAFFVGSQYVTRAEFYDFIRTSDFFNAYPGFSTFAYIRRVSPAEKENFLAEMRADTSVRPEGYPSFAITPEGKRDEYWPIVYISPEDTAGFLLGNDQRAETVRAENIARARDLGSISLSGAVQLNQGGIGALIAAPLYEGKRTPGSIEDRRRLFEGAVTISLRIEDFFEDILSPFKLEGQHMNIAIAGRDTDPMQLLVAEIPDDFFTRVFGTMEAVKKIELGADSVQLIFKAPARNQLVLEEVFEPLLLILILLSSAVVISLIIIISQKSKLAVDLKKHYAFVSTLSHQLRTPLTNLRWYLEIREVPEKEKETQQALMRGVSVLHSILSRMLLYIAMAKEDITANNKTKVGIEVLYKKTLRAVSEKYDISRIERTGDKEIAKNVFVDEEKVASALGYLIENALIYSPKEKGITVELTTDTRTLSVAVIDHGYGIPKNEQGEVFSEFFRASNASLGINYGSGVSIFMAKKIIEAHGGTIAFTSRENEGSVFTVKLPLA